MIPPKPRQIDLATFARRTDLAGPEPQWRESRRQLATLRRERIKR